MKCRTSAVDSGREGRSPAIAYVASSARRFRLLLEKFLINLFEVDGLFNTAADVVPNHQSGQLAAVNEYDTFAKNLSVNYVDVQRHLAKGDDGSGKMV